MINSRIFLFPDIILPPSSGYYGSATSSSASSGGVITGSCETKALFNGDSSSEGAAGAILDGDCSRANDRQSLLGRYSISLLPSQRIAFYQPIGNSPLHIKVLDAERVVRGEAAGLTVALPSKGTMLPLDAGTYTLEVSFVDPSVRGDYFIQLIKSNPEPAYINQQRLAARCAGSWSLLPAEGELYLPITCFSGSLGTNHYFIHFLLDLPEASDKALEMSNPDFSPQITIWNRAGEIVSQQKSDPNKPLLIPAKNYLIYR